MNFKAAFGRLQTFSGSLRDALLDICDRCVGLLCIAVGDEPARAFRNVATHQQHTEPEEAADPESEAPAEVWCDQARIEEQERSTGARHRSKPKAAIDDEVDATSISRRNQFINSRINRRVFAADTQASDGAKYCEA